MKCRKRFITETQMLTSTRDTNSTLRKELAAVSKRLDILNGEILEERQSFNELKAKRERLRKTLSKLNDSSGLLDPQLQIDYDRTVKLIEQYLGSEI